MISAATRASIAELTRRKARTTFAVVTLALAVGSLGILAVPALTDRTMQHEVAATRLSDLTVFTRPLALDPPELARLAALPGVAAVEPHSAFGTRVLVGERRASAYVLGVRDFADQRVDVVRIASGAAPGPGAVLTEEQDRRSGRLAAGTGDTVRVLAADGSVQSLAVAGEGHNVSSGQDVVADGTIVLYAPQATVEALSGERGYTSVSFRLRDPATADATLAAIRAELQTVPGFAGFTDLPDRRAAGDWPGKEALEQYSELLYVVTLLALLSALTLLANTMTTLVGEQTREIGTMKAIGGRRRQIAAVYLRTALLLGALGAALGTVLGVLLANALAGFLGPEFFAVEPAFAVDVPVVVLSLAVGLLGPCLAALPAIRRGVRVTARDAMEATGADLGEQGRLDRALRRLRRLPVGVQIGLRGLGRRKRRTLTTALQVGLAVATLLAVLGLAAAAQQSTVAAWDEHGEDVSVWSSFGRPLDMRAGAVIAGVEGVAAAEAVLKNEVVLAGEDAFFWGLPQQTMFHHDVTRGRWFSAAEERDRAQVAVIEQDLARITGTDVGDRVRVTTAAGPVELDVIGVADNRQEGGTVLFVPVTTMRSVLGDADGYDYFIRTTSRDEALIDRTTTRVEDALSVAGYHPASEVTYVAKADEVASNRTITMTITVLGFVIVAISMVGLASAMTMSVLERTREVGILRCVGARARDVRRIFAAEGVAVAVLGWLLGIPLGYALDALLVWLVREVVGIEIELAFPLRNVPLALAGTVVLALLVMLVPIHRAVRLRPGDALRHA